MTSSAAPAQSPLTALAEAHLHLMTALERLRARPANGNGRDRAQRPASHRPNGGR